MSLPDPLPARFGQPIQSAPQQIAARIKESILDGTLQAGARLPTEQQLTETFGVSRPTLREALKELRAAKILVAERGRNGGYRVTEFSPRSLAATMTEFISLALGAKRTTHAQIFEVREALEVLVAQTAARNRTDRDLERLEAILNGHHDHDFDDLLRADIGFHRALAEATHNPLIVAYVSASSIALTQAQDLEASHSEQVIGHLDEVLDAVRAQDPEPAGEAMRLHLQYFANFYANYDEQPSP